MSVTTTPLSAIENRVFRNSELFEGTPVGDRDNAPKIQLCIELRKKEVKTTRRNTKAKLELVLEVSVMYLKNLPVRELKGNSGSSTFVKIRLTPGQIIHSTELKMDKQNKEKVDLEFIEVFGFSIPSTDSLEGKKLEVLVCDKKMTRNANIFGQTEISMENVLLGKPVIKWFTLSSESSFSD